MIVSNIRGRLRGNEANQQTIKNFEGLLAKENIESSE